MRTTQKQKAFTIVELLTVMSIIILLIGLLVPGLSRIRRYATGVKQNAQFHSIGIALEFFNAEWDGYPPSEAFDKAGLSYRYCGAMKLAEAMVGKDSCGFNTDSRFVAGNVDGLYYGPILFETRKQYLQLKGKNIARIGDLYTAPVPFDPCEIVLCDEYSHRIASGKRKGMPILYYKANASNTRHADPDPYKNIYDVGDNQELVALGTYDGESHFLDFITFYEEIRDKEIVIPRPYRVDSYILISAGFDGKYGLDADGKTDDVFNFNR